MHLRTQGVNSKAFLFTQGPEVKRQVCGTRSTNTALSRQFPRERSAQPGWGWEYIQHCVAEWEAAAMDTKPKGMFLAPVGGCVLQG